MNWTPRLYYWTPDGMLDVPHPDHLQRWQGERYVKARDAELLIEEAERRGFERAKREREA